MRNGKASREMTEDSKGSAKSERRFGTLSQDCAYLDRTAIFQLRSSMTLTEQLLYPHRLDKELKASIANSGNKDIAKQVSQSGRRKKAVVKGIKEVCFDRGEIPLSWQS